MTTDQAGEGRALTKRQQALKDRRDEAAAIQAAQPLSWFRAVSDDARLLGPAVWVAGALLRRAPGQAQPWMYQGGREREHRWEFFMSVPDIGRYARLKERAVQQGLRDLQAHGYLHQLARGGKRGTVPIASTWLLILPEPGESPNPQEAQVGDGDGSDPNLLQAQDGNSGDGDGESAESESPTRTNTLSQPARTHFPNLHQTQHQESPTQESPDSQGSQAAAGLRPLPSKPVPDSGGGTETNSSQEGNHRPRGTEDPDASQSGTSEVEEGSAGQPLPEETQDTSSEPTEPATPGTESDQQPAEPTTEPSAPPPADLPAQPATDTQPKTPDPAEGQQKPPGVSEGVWAAASAGEARGASHRTSTKHEAAA